MLCPRYALEACGPKVWWIGEKRIEERGKRKVES